MVRHFFSALRRHATSVQDALEERSDVSWTARAAERNEQNRIESQRTRR
jgi:hypothetical protein